jgi:uncharacterized surface protein with fasciclin (FAS1) repeats
MTIKPLIAAALLATSAMAAPVLANHHAETPAAMQASANIVETAMSVDDLSTLVAAVKAAGLVDALSGDGPLTVFAPTNHAFADLTDGTVAALLMPENKDQLTKILTSHVVAGFYDAATLTALAEANDGRINLTTLSGAKIKAKIWDGKLYVKDENGGKADIAMADVQTSNGVVHVVSSVLLPK